MLKLFRLSAAVAAAAIGAGMQAHATADSIPDGFARPLHAGLGIDAGFSVLMPTNSYLGGNNSYRQRGGTAFTPGLRLELRFDPDSRQGMLYHGLYQGAAISTDFNNRYNILGRPVSAFVFQGAPIAHLAQRLWLGYEWQFGAAFGWKHYNEVTMPDNVAISTSTTAHIGLNLTLNYRVAESTTLRLSMGARHFSNGNTEWPNAGVNTLGVSLGIVYSLGDSQSEPQAPEQLSREADRGRWTYDIVGYGAWRKRVVGTDGSQELVPGHFAVTGLQFSPLRHLNRWVAVGPSLDLQWDEGANLDSNRVEGAYGDNMFFYRPSFGSQLSAGISAHAELTMPIFSVNAGLGYDFIKPAGNKRFYQSLTLKAFVWRGIFLNVGYRLGEFKTPQNLMLGLGIRL